MARRGIDLSAGRAGMALPVLLLVALMLGIAIQPAAKETRYARVENQTNDVIFVTYKEVVAGNPAKVQIQLYPGESRRLDLTRVEGEVCAWGGKEYEPTKKIDCRSLTPGDTWTIH